MTNIIHCRACRRNSEVVTITTGFKKAIKVCGLCRSTNHRPATKEESLSVVAVKKTAGLRLFGV